MAVVSETLQKEIGVYFMHFFPPSYTQIIFVDHIALCIGLNLFSSRLKLPSLKTEVLALEDKRIHSGAALIKI